MADNLKRDSGHSSGGATGTAAFGGGGILAPNRFAANPFARSAAHKTDIDDEKKDRPIIAPATFTPMFGGAGGSDKISAASGEKTANADDNSTTSRNSIYLRPSALSSKTVNFGKGFTATKLNSSDRGFEKAASENVAPVNSISTSSEPVLSPPKSDSKSDEAVDEATAQTTTAEATSPDQKTADNQASSSGFIFGKNLGERVCGVPKISDGPKEADNPPLPSTSSSDLRGSGFVFGRNIAERVTGTPASPTDLASGNEASTSSKTSGGGAGSLSSGASLQFIGANNVSLKDLNADSSDAMKNGNVATSPSTDKTTTLAESASAYQAKHAVQEFNEVPTFTGEEAESNVLQINCKLYMFEKATHNWLERGRGLLRLNDKSADNDEPFHSRIIIRMHGTLTVILNTKVWSGMMVERASSKSIHITGQCDDGIRVFLVMAGSKDIDNLFGAVDWRVQQLKMTEESNHAASAAETAPQLPPSSTKRSINEEDDDDDEDESNGNTKREAKKLKSDVSSSATQGAAAALDPKERREVAQDDSNDSSSIDPEVSNDGTTRPTPPAPTKTETTSS
ncbi:uncharacterized protein LOC141913134 [Tubulanus polymorphus]|uniref:uncharacterized protein LOC141913134 n=1 Tax=Tubulanus polymorphus TaxID=672921 RepID=UPI003DA6652E